MHGNWWKSWKKHSSYRQQHHSNMLVLQEQVSVFLWVWRIERCAWLMIWMWNPWHHLPPHMQGQGERIECLPLETSLPSPIPVIWLLQKSSHAKFLMVSSLLDTITMHWTFWGRKNLAITASFRSVCVMPRFLSHQFSRTDFFPIIFSVPLTSSSQVFLTYLNPHFLYWLQMDPSYEPPPTESRTLYGLTLEQKRNDATIDGSLFSTDKIVTSNKQVMIIRFPQS